ncbi:hypothetical protein C0995_010559 [Termitomyces sp. Mi166|nr:hypothetical protein C0995_010559 [Termitomyces sp. Mi166\
MTPSYQLPDLLSLCQAFELHTNDFCRPATVTSESWLLSLKTAESNDLLTSVERDCLRSAKFGLLAALCVPGCGQPQLTFFANFISILSIADGRIKAAQSEDRSGWLSDIKDTNDGVIILGKHELFQYLLPELERLIEKATAAWTARFTHSVHSYHSSQLQLISGHIHDAIPDFESYLPLRSDLSGLRLLLDLIELAENFTLPPMDEVVLQKFTRLKHLAIDIIYLMSSIVQDVVAFNNDQVQGNHYNLITVLMTHKNLSLQGAVNLAGSTIKEMFDSFIETEKSLFSPPRPSQTNKSRTSTFYYPLSWFTSLRSTAPSESLVPISEQGDDLARLGDLPSYVQTLKDCIVGTINWAYETELYFGKKGEEIRTFGWVFLNPAADSQEA